MFVRFELREKKKDVGEWGSGIDIIFLLLYFLSFRGYAITQRMPLKSQMYFASRAQAKWDCIFGEAGDVKPARVARKLKKWVSGNGGGDEEKRKVLQALSLLSAGEGKEMEGVKERDIRAVAWVGGLKGCKKAALEMEGRQIAPQTWSSLFSIPIQFISSFYLFIYLFSSSHALIVVGILFTPRNPPSLISCRRSASDSFGLNHSPLRGFSIQ